MDSQKRPEAAASCSAMRSPVSRGPFSCTAAQSSDAPIPSASGITDPSLRASSLSRCASSAMCAGSISGTVAASPTSAGSPRPAQIATGMSAASPVGELRGS